MSSLASKSGFRSYSYFSKASDMKQRHEALRLNRIFNFFASIALVLFILLLIGLVEMRVSSVQNVGQGQNEKSKNPLEVGWHVLWQGPLSAMAAAKQPTPQYAASITTISPTELELQSGETATLKISLDNIGSFRWRRSGQYMVTYNVVGTKGASPLFHQSWYKIRQPSRLIEEMVEPKGVGTFEFIVQAPKNPGTYKETFEAVTKNNKIIKGSRFTITLNVSPKVEATTNPSAGQFSENLSSIGANEPNIRVGLFKISSNEVTRVSYDSPYDLVRSNGELIKNMAGGQITALSYDSIGRVYRAETDSGTFEDQNPIHLIPKNMLDAATIITASQLHQWNPNVIDNRFRGLMEIDYSPEKNSIWVINQLPIEYYLRGVDVGGDNFNSEFLKSIYTAARSYAMFHYTNPYKHAGVGFTLDAVIDQAYRGLNQELRTPRASQAIDATQGMVVAYKNDVAITPYFGQSDGRTHSWSEVWGGQEKPWLVSVTTPGDAGKSLRGHGVGMPVTEARAQAQAGSKWNDILKYFYQGTALKKLY